MTVTVTNANGTQKYLGILCIYRQSADELVLERHAEYTPRWIHISLPLVIGAIQIEVQGVTSPLVSN
jgi:hypothetical protein